MRDLARLSISHDGFGCQKTGAKITHSKRILIISNKSIFPETHFCGDRIVAIAADC